MSISGVAITRNCLRILAAVLLVNMLTQSVGGSASTMSAQEKTSRPADLRAAITRHLDMTYSVPYFRTKEEWLERRESLRKQILVAAGLFPVPAKCALNAQIFDRMDRKTYSIEKVYFESYPGFYVTGNLYRPLGKSGPFPGVVTPHGHWPYGRLQNSELCSAPARCISMAQQGYIVFSYDMVGYNDSRQVDHRFQGEREALWSFGTLGLQLWNSVRSLDFLESLPDVARARLGCTGESGGGTQTFLLTAVDERVSVSAPVNMISAHMQGGDVCENAPNLRIDTNNVEIASIMAPRPMLMVSATGDWTKNTLNVEYPAVRNIYRLMGAEDKVAAVQEKADHNYNKESRQHVYRWFAKWLQGASSSEAFVEKDVRVESASDTLVFYGRSLPSPYKSQSEIIGEYIQRAQDSIDNSKPTDARSLQTYLSSFLPALRYSVMAEWPSPDTVQAFASQPLQTVNHQVVRFYLQRRSKGDRVPSTLWLPPAKIPVRQAVLLVHPAGASHFEKDGVPDDFVERLIGQGCSVLIPDVFNTGRAEFQRLDKRNFFTTYNRTDQANRVQDVITALAYLRDQAGKLPIKVAGFEEAGLWCLFARALALDDAAFAIDLHQFEAGDDGAYLKAMNIPGIRKAGDVRTAAISNMRGRIWMQNPGRTFPSEWIQTVYRSVGSESLIRIDVDRVGSGAITEWILQGAQSGK